MNRALLIALLPATLIGCAAPVEPSAPAATVAAADASCDREVKTGSMMPTVRCRTAAEREADRKSAEGASDFVRRTNQVMQPGK